MRHVQKCEQWNGRTAAFAPLRASKKKKGKPSKCRRRTCRRTIRVGGELETVTFENDSDPTDRFLRFSHYRSPAVREYSDTRLVQSFRRLVQRPGLLAVCVMFVFEFCAETIIRLMYRCQVPRIAGKTNGRRRRRCCCTHETDNTNSHRCQ